MKTVSRICVGSCAMVLVALAVAGMARTGTLAYAHSPDEGLAQRVEALEATVADLETRLARYEESVELRDLDSDGTVDEVAIQNLTAVDFVSLFGVIHNVEIGEAVIHNAEIGRAIIHNHRLGSAF